MYTARIQQTMDETMDSKQTMDETIGNTFYIWIVSKLFIPDAYTGSSREIETQLDLAISLLCALETCWHGFEAVSCDYRNWG